MMQDSDKNQPVKSDDQVVNQLTDAVQTQVTVSGQGVKSSDATPEFSVSNLAPPSSLPQLSSPVTLPHTNFNQQLGPMPMLLNQVPNPNQGPPPSGAPSLLMAGKPTPGPPPKSGFQPVQHAVQAYETSHPSHQSQSPMLVPNSPPQSTPAGVNIFTPSYDPNAAPSPYSMPPPPPTMQYSQPGAPGPAQPQQNTDTAVQLNMGSSGVDPTYFQTSNSQDVGIIDWIKSNETVNMVMQKAKTGVQHVITAMDPQMRDVLYSGGDIDILVASGKLVKIEPVKHAFQEVFGRATVDGMDSQPAIAPQPVGFTAGIKGAEERINGLRRNGQTKSTQVCVAIESFIVDVQPEMWYDISCLMLSDPVRNITIQTFSQATPVNLEYVHQAQNETPPDYELSWSGLGVTVGQIMHRQCAVDPSDWHFYFTGVSRRDTLYLAAKQLAYMYKQRLPRS